MPTILKALNTVMKVEIYTKMRLCGCRLQLNALGVLLHMCGCTLLVSTHLYLRSTHLHTHLKPQALRLNFGCRLFQKVQPYLGEFILNHITTMQCTCMHACRVCVCVRSPWKAPVLCAMGYSVNGTKQVNGVDALFVPSADMWVELSLFIVIVVMLFCVNYDRPVTVLV